MSETDKNKYANKPNLLRVAVELSKCKSPDRALEVLGLALMDCENVGTAFPTFNYGRARGCQAAEAGK